MDLPHLPQWALLVHLGVPVLQTPLVPQLLGQLNSLDAVTADGRRGRWLATSEANWVCGIGGG